MDPWEVFSELCRRVVEGQNVMLEVMIFQGRILMNLSPYSDFDDEEENNE